MAYRRPKIPNTLPPWMDKHAASVIYAPGARPGDPSYECLGGGLCGSTVVMRLPHTCMVPGVPPGPHVYPGIYVGCLTCGVMYFHIGGVPRCILPCGHPPNDYRGTSKV